MPSSQKTRASDTGEANARPKRSGSKADTGKRVEKSSAKTTGKSTAKAGSSKAKADAGRTEQPAATNLQTRMRKGTTGHSRVAAQPPKKGTPVNTAESAAINARNTLVVEGARVHNLKDVTIEIPRDKLVVITGLSGSGKSSLAFDTIYAEGQRRYMESLSSFAKRFIAQVDQADVDAVHGLSPVVSIEQKTIARNPRSTVGTLTDIAPLLNLLFAKLADAWCPRSGEPVPVRTTAQIAEEVLSLPQGTEVELRAPVYPIYGEDLDVLYEEIRKHGCRRLRMGDEIFDLADRVPEEDRAKKEPLDVIVDQFVVNPTMEKQLRLSIEHALMVGDSMLSVHITSKCAATVKRAFARTFGSKTTRCVYGDIAPDFFMFNNPESACRTCGGIGTHKETHRELLVPDPSRSIRGGCFVREAFKYAPDSWSGYAIYSLSKAYAFNLDTPWEDLKTTVQDLILYGTDKPLKMLHPPDAKSRNQRWLDRKLRFGGIARQVERSYTWYRKRGEANSNMEAWLDRVMVDIVCPDCHGSRLRPTRSLFTLSGRTLHEFGDVNFDELRPLVDGLSVRGPHAEAGRKLLAQIARRLDLLLGIGLDYLNFNRASGTLSGGEAQRIRLSTQIGSGLIGMLYVLDEPSIGLHPKDNIKMINMLTALRDIGNTVLVVEHDEATIRAADYVVEMGPGPGVHGGRVVAQGKLNDVLETAASPTAEYLSGRAHIPVPQQRRPHAGKTLVVRSAEANNLKSIDVTVPLGQFVCVTGTSGSGKSTLINDIVYKRLWKELVDTRTLAGAHADLEGVVNVTRVVNIDQTPIGRNARSNPATYVGFWDKIRDLFTSTNEAQLRGYKPGRFSFNVKGGRCDECQGDGRVRTEMYFMPDVEVLCPTCKGRRFNAETLEVEYEGLSVADVLEMSIEDGVGFFADVSSVSGKLEVLDDLGLGYLTLGQAATTLSGGEAQRIKLATELSKLQRRGHTLYILDEPTTGLHLADVNRLLECLHRLVDAGHTVCVIEHHLDVIKTADHVIDLGPEGGRGGGEVLVAGTPEEVAACERSYTGRFLRESLSM